MVKQNHHNPDVLEQQLDQIDQ